MFSKKIFLLVIMMLALASLPVSGCAAPSGSDVQMKAALEKIQKPVQAELDKLDAGLADAAVKLGGSGLSGSGARQILEALYSKYPYLVDCSAVDIAGNVTTMVPETYRRYEGSNIGTQDVTAPAFSPFEKMVEGVTGVSLMRPIVDGKGKQIGIVDVMFVPGSMLDGFVTPVIKGTGMALNVVQVDGMTIYDQPQSDTGKNLLKDAEFQQYKELVAMGSRFATEESGTGTYTFPSHSTSQTVKKMAVWSSVRLHGTAWRLVVVQEEGK